jgi:mannitol-specific phosphotransferase system IIBC component
MKTADQKGVEPQLLATARLGAGSWAVVVVLLLLLAGTAVIVYQGWTLANGADVPASGYVAMALGVVISLGVGFGLMALIFYSSRKGYDEPPVLILSEAENSRSVVASDSKKRSDAT